MSKVNAVKFKAIVNKADLKEILCNLFDQDVQIKYPQLANAKNEIPIRGICLLGDFESLVNVITPKDLDFLGKLRFQQNVNFKVIEIEQNPVDLPTGVAKEESKSSLKK